MREKGIERKKEKYQTKQKKNRRRETPTLSTDADSRTDTKGHRLSANLRKEEKTNYQSY